MKNDDGLNSEAIIDLVQMSPSISLFIPENIDICIMNTVCNVINSDPVYVYLAWQWALTRKSAPR